jgi:hypothetical protein
LEVGGFNMMLEGGLLMRCASLIELFVEGKHLIHQGDHAIVADDIDEVGEIDDTSWKWTMIIGLNLKHPHLKRVWKMMGNRQDLSNAQ